MGWGVWARKTTALALATLLAGPSVDLLAAQDAPPEDREAKRERRRRQEEKQQEREQARQQEQQERRQQREERAQQQEERQQQEREQRQREREERAQRQQERQDGRERQRQEEQERLQQEQPRLSRQQQIPLDQQPSEAARRRPRPDGVQERDARQAAERARAEEEARAAERAQAAERARQEAQSRRPRPSLERSAGREARLSESTRGRMIRENQQRSTRYFEGWPQRERGARERAYQLQRQHRLAQYRYQQQYLDRLRAQWARQDGWRPYDYDRDPYFWSAPEYRYRYQGRWYETSRYGAGFLEDAVNRGYEEGFLAGQADRQDGWRRGYRDSYAYEDASYGYRGLYVDLDQYRHYFRQVFQRVYEDGYHARHENGQRIDGTLKVLAAVLAGILIFEALD